MPTPDNLAGRSPSSVSGVVGRVGRFFQRQLWVWPVLAACALGGLGWVVRAKVERSVKDNLGNQLQVIRDVEIAALTLWSSNQVRTVEALARESAIRSDIVELVATAEKVQMSDLELGQCAPAKRLPGPCSRAPSGCGRRWRATAALHRSACRTPRPVLASCWRRRSSRTRLARSTGM